VGKYLVEAYNQYYSRKGEATTLSALDLTQLPALYSALNALGERLGASSDLKAIQAQAVKAQRFYFDDYADLGSLISNVKSAGEAEGERQQVSSALKAVVTANMTTKINAQGLSIWWPKTASQWMTYKQRYMGLASDKATGWHTLLEKIY
jgi:hypothetical protein